jgi:radical SAM-linked protein
VRNIRIFFSKKGRARFISHLDMTRLFQRAVRRTGITMWYTEGFHPHLYMTFALPLSLGTESECECVDMKLVDDISLEAVRDRLNATLPEGIEVYRVSEPSMKTNRIESSEYLVTVPESQFDKFAFEDFIKKDEINAIKKGKAGEKLVNIKPWIYGYSISQLGENVQIYLRLASGNTNTLNPNLLLSVFSEQSGADLCDAAIIRKKIFAENGDIFA